MSTDLQQRRAPAVRADSDLTFSPDELATLLKRASSESGVTGKHPLSLADALQSARELGIPEERVLMAAEEMKKEKVRVATRGIRLSRRRDAFLRFLFTMLAVSAGLALVAGARTGVIVLFSMSIPLFILGARWAMAFLNIRDDREPDLKRVLRQRDRR